MFLWEMFVWDLKVRSSLHVFVFVNLKCLCEWQIMMKCGTYKVSSDTCGFFFLLVTNIVCGLLLCDRKNNFLICAWHSLVYVTFGYFFCLCVWQVLSESVTYTVFVCDVRGTCYVHTRKTRWKWRLKWNFTNLPSFDKSEMVLYKWLVLSHDPKPTMTRKW